MDARDFIPTNKLYNKMLVINGVGIDTTYLKNVLTSEYTTHIFTQLNMNSAYEWYAFDLSTVDPTKEPHTWTAMCYADTLPQLRHRFVQEVKKQLEERKKGQNMPEKPLSIDEAIEINNNLDIEITKL